MMSQSAIRDRQTIIGYATFGSTMKPGTFPAQMNVPYRYQTSMIDALCTSLPIKASKIVLYCQSAGNANTPTERARASRARIHQFVDLSRRLDGVRNANTQMENR